MLGRFNGRTFTPESTVLPSEWGINCYAGQTWNNEPSGRRVFIGWMRGGEYPAMPFNQQMSFPRSFSLKTTADGIRLHQAPITEIEELYTGNSLVWTNVILEPGSDPLIDCRGDLWDVTLRLSSSQDSQIQFGFHGYSLKFDIESRNLSVFDKTVELPPGPVPIELRMLIDRTSIEIFAGSGRIVMSFCFVPKGSQYGLSLTATGGRTLIESLTAQELKSIWN
jgi:sucrose-6-phosphate hydrolase SacC (GH32 family)